jgi:hypothetical protein
MTAPLNPRVQLQLTLWELDIEPRDALQMLHDAGIISDNVIELREIAVADIPKAINHLRSQCDVGF